LFPQSLWNPAVIAIEGKTEPNETKIQPQDTAKQQETAQKEPDTETSQTDTDQKPVETKQLTTTVTKVNSVEPGSAKQNTNEESSETVEYTDDLLVIKAGDVMNRCLVWAGPEDSVGQILSQMQSNNTGYVLIGKNGVCQGIVSRSNIAGAISPFLKPIFARWRRPLDDASLQIKVKWIMSTPVHVVKADITLYSVLNTMNTFAGRCLPVVGADGKVIGIITVFDIFKAMISNDSEEVLIGTTKQSPPLV